MGWFVAGPHICISAICFFSLRSRRHRTLLCQTAIPKDGVCSSRVPGVFLSVHVQGTGPFRVVVRAPLEKPTNENEILAIG